MNEATDRARREGQVDTEIDYLKKRMARVEYAILAVLCGAAALGLRAMGLVF